MSNPLKHRSGLVTDGLERAPARGMLRAVGMKDEDFQKPQIGIASSWNEIDIRQAWLGDSWFGDKKPERDLSEILSSAGWNLAFLSDHQNECPTEFQKSFETPCHEDIMYGKPQIDGRTNWMKKNDDLTNQNCPHWRGIRPNQPQRQCT